MSSIPPFAQGVLLSIAIVVVIALVYCVAVARPTQASHVPVARFEGDDDLEPTQDEVDLWVDVFKMQLKKDTSVMAAAEVADRAVRQFNDRYGDNSEDEDDI